ncbi:hypothetical protein ATPR_1811 [Acetobacter tropicalis NBRC 101654]|uniref:Uncharacterized protein n=1 Tax=Acetobacter tropicalis NBRC 101654 TaxID=749388 RepID=F7VEL2_9PROT|nr:hypothetical protein ATPR_1811 [Acetobacter tropicalis NBRC 101654]
MGFIIDAVLLLFFFLAIIGRTSAINCSFSFWMLPSLTFSGDVVYETQNPHCSCRPVGNLHSGCLHAPATGR